MTDATTFSNSEWLRYTRHIQLPQLGATGQQKLKQSRVLIIGSGGLGSPVSLYLAAAGIGHIILVDGDTVDLTNLQRQVLFDTHQVGQPKAKAAKQRLTALNPEIKITAVSQPFSQENSESLVSQADLVIDCTDNFATRYLINDVCSMLKKPWVFASIHQFSGQCALFTPETACFRCLFPETPTDVADCNAAGVLGVLPGMLGIFQANEAIKYLAGLATPLKNTLLLIEAIDLTFRKIKLSKASDCLVCTNKKSPKDLSEFYQFSCAPVTVDTVEISPKDFDSLKQIDNYLVLDVRTDAERAAFHIGGDHIPLSKLERQYQKLDQTKTILCYCQSGVRSRKAADILTDRGYKSRSLQNGLAGWLKSNTEN